MSIPPDLHNRLRTALLRCEAFESDNALEAIFVESPINQWVADLPEATSDDKRVRATIKYLLGKRDTNGEHALVLLLRVLNEQMPTEDARHEELADLAEELKHEFELHPPQLEAPETFAQKFAHFFTGDTEAQRAYRYRLKMLKQMRLIWIEGVLERSIHGAMMIVLKMEYKPEAVEYPWNTVLQEPKCTNKMLPKGTKIIDVFNEMDGTLLILGDPGSGKTTMLLELAREAIARAEEDPMQPIPVVLQLSSWVTRDKYAKIEKHDRKEQDRKEYNDERTVKEWLIEELNVRYGIPSSIAQLWIEKEMLLLLLDGLDEMDTELQTDCVKAINIFRGDYGLTPLVICSCVEDYEALTVRLKLQGAVTLQPLTSEQIEQYLAAAGIETDTVRTMIQRDPILQEMAQSPLTLNIAMLTYGQHTQDSQAQDIVGISRKHLFDIFVQRMLTRKGTAQQYPPKQAYHWLVWATHNLLADEILPGDGSLILLCVLKAKEKRCVNTIISGLMFGLVGGLAGMIYDNRIVELIVGLMIGPIVGLIVKPTAKSIIMFIKDVFEALLRNYRIHLRGIDHVGNLTLEDMVITDTLVLGLIGGVVAKLVNKPVGGAVGALFAGLLITIISGLLWRFRIHQEATSYLQLEQVPIRETEVPRQRFNAYYFGRTMLISGIIGGVVGALIDETIGGIVGGLLWIYAIYPIFTIRQFILRVILYRNNNIPWNYARFFDYCVERNLLHKTGSIYIFIHRLLQEHFASLTPEDIERIAGDSRAIA